MARCAARRYRPIAVVLPPDCALSRLGIAPDQPQHMTVVSTNFCNDQEPARDVCERGLGGRETATAAE
jgi:hypothetical protein